MASEDSSIKCEEDMGLLLVGKAVYLRLQDPGAGLERERDDGHNDTIQEHILEIK